MEDGYPFNALLSLLIPPDRSNKPPRMPANYRQYEGFTRMTRYIGPIKLVILDIAGTVCDGPQREICFSDGGIWIWSDTT